MSSCALHAPCAGHGMAVSAEAESSRVPRTASQRGPKRVGVHGVGGASQGAGSGSIRARVASPRPKSLASKGKL
jgi:hypothetical protein